MAPLRTAPTLPTRPAAGIGCSTRPAGPKVTSRPQRLRRLSRRGGAQPTRRAQPTQPGTAGRLPRQLFGALAVIGDVVTVMTPALR